MNKTIGKYLVLAAFLGAFGSMAADEETLASGEMSEQEALFNLGDGLVDNIFGKDDRVPITTNQYPWSPVGYLSTGCTGTLVSKDVVVTAAHCVISGKGASAKPIWNITFSPNRVNGVAQDTVGINYMWYGTNDPDTHRAADWAVIRLTQPLGLKYGFMGTSTREDIDRMSLAGYSADYNSGKTATAAIGCYVKKRVGGYMLHDCDMTRGASGGPMFTMISNSPVILGINVAEYRDGGDKSLTLPGGYTDKNANIAIPTKVFQAKLKELLN